MSTTEEKKIHRLLKKIKPISYGEETKRLNLPFPYDFLSPGYRSYDSMFPVASLSVISPMIFCIPYKGFHPHLGGSIVVGVLL